jgi:hypothetical protein
MKRASILSLCLVAALAAPAAAAEWTVTITNATNGTYFTPFVVAAHGDNADVFDVGQPASLDVQRVAECGDTGGVIASLTAAGADLDINPAGGRLAPGMTTTAVLNPAPWQDRLSVIAMLIPTNDGFVGLDSIQVPKVPGTYTYAVNGYDAGTEANSEVLDTSGCVPGMPGIPGDPTGLAGTGGTGVATADYNTNIHIHPGVVGDLDPNGGPSDLDASVHDWNNPVGYITVTVGRKHHGHHDRWDH